MKVVAFAGIVMVLVAIGLKVREWQCREVYKAADMTACMVWR